VYNVLVTTTRVLVSVAAIVVKRPLSKGKLVALDAPGAGTGVADGIGVVELAMAELSTTAELSSKFAVVALREAGPGWTNPGSPVALPAATLLVTRGVGEPAGGTDTLS
jgi:hypothetical protein